MPSQFKKKIQDFLKDKTKQKIQLTFIDSYDELMDRIGNSEEMLKKLLNIFYNTYVDIDKELEEIKDEDERYIYIHSLKGALGNLGCKNMYDQLAKIEALVKNGRKKKKLEEFLEIFKNVLKELRESTYIKENIKKVLMITSDNEGAEKVKKLLYPYFELIITKTEDDLYFILDTNHIDLIILGDLDNVQEEINIIKKLKSSDKYKEISLLLYNNKKNHELKAKALELNIDEYLEADMEVDEIKWHIENSIQKKQSQIKLKNDLNKTSDEMENVYDFLYSSLVNLTSYKSKETGAHLLRTKEYMKVMLKKYEVFYKEGLFADDKTIQDIAIAATLHDIGKVGIPDSILNKPGRLTDDEYEIMKQHVVIGRETLEGTYGSKLSNSVLQYAKDIVYHHHEKYDGTGYPEGLKNDQITTISKIMAIIDVYDALANDRVYKKAMPYDEVEEYIESQSGKAFDPKIINIFRLAKAQLRRINEANKD